MSLGNEEMGIKSVTLANKLVEQISGEHWQVVLEALSMVVASACVEISPNESREIMNMLEKAAEVRRQMLQARVEREIGARPVDA